ncbi:TIGR03619 family F420-dependent LLM class oxidoreductase [Phenylobacterium sp. LjRoot219]|uniref:TIGR03619 family F420-dependent LLM class oxidoreductase n=1 Tax=Phenylobacterium sp. LjRoot219 TaxID=3342283 RepID=UPI003ED09CB4
MKFTLAIPLGEIAPRGEFQSIEAIGQMAQALELAGVGACYVTDHPAPSADWLHANGHDALDPFTALAFVAAASRRLLLHTNIVVLPYRNPFVTAKAAATLQVLSGGRLILGVGGGYQKGEFEALGVDFHQRGALFDEALEVLRLAWSGGVVVKEGRNFAAAGNEPRPAPDPQPRVWIGGGSDKAVERAARWGDGWCPFFAAPTMSKLNQDSGIQTVAQLAGKIAQLQDLRAAQGRTGPFDVSIGPQVRIKDRTRAEAEQYLEAVDALAQAGVTWVGAELGHESRAAYLENVQWFGEEIIGSGPGGDGLPAFRGHDGLRGHQRGASQHGRRTAAGSAAQPRVIGVGGAERTP